MYTYWFGLCQMCAVMHTLHGFIAMFGKSRAAKARFARDLPRSDREHVKLTLHVKQTLHCQRAICFPFV